MRLLCGVVAALVLLASAPTVLARAVWTTNSVGVYDYTSAAWRPIVAATVEEFNAMLPAQAPSLYYRVIGETPCDQIDPDLFRGGIVVCSAPALSSSDELGLTEFFVERGQISRVRITLSEEFDPTLRDNIVCHEFMHAITGIRDNYGALPDTSCVWGNLNAPGSFDVQYVRKLYKDNDTSSGGKKHGGKRHGGKKHAGRHGR